MTRYGWINVDLDGLEKLLARRGKEFVVYELIQNAWDERVSRVDVTLEPEGRGLHRLRVVDDSPDGFADLTHAYTLYAESKKKPDPTRRGLFNAGEKFVLALCREATITTMTGQVIFAADGTRRMGRGRTASGSVFDGVIRLTLEEARQIAERVRWLIPPIPTCFNGVEIPTRVPVEVFGAVLPTVVSDPETGDVLRAHRYTEVRIYEPPDGEVAALYELGIPVVETGDRWHVDVQQKVPLNAERDNVTPGYLKEVRAEVLNHITDRLTKADAASVWVREASGSHWADDKAVSKVLDLSFGERRASFDPADPEANALAVSRGYTLVTGGALTADQWARAKQAGAIQPSSVVTPSPKPFSPDGTPLELLPRDQWTAGMERFARLAARLASELIDRPVAVEIANDRGWEFGGCFNGDRLIVNLARQGHGFFDAPLEERPLGFLIHEFAHHFEKNHLDEKYHDALRDLGARLTVLALRKPGTFEEG